MSSDDKRKLNGVAEGATANLGTITGIASTDPIVGAGNSGAVTLSHANSGVESGTYGDLSTHPVTPDFGATFNVPGYTVNESGHITNSKVHTVKIPNDEETS